MTPALDLAACTATAWQATPDMALRLGVAAGAGGLAGWASARRFFAGQRSFAGMLVAVSLWIMLSVGEHAAVAPACKATLGLLSWPMVLGQPMLWALFLYQYLRHQPHAPALRTRALLALPALVLLALAWTNGWHGLHYGPGSALTPPLAGLPRLRYEYGPAFVAAAGLGYGWLALACVLMLRGWRSLSPSQRSERRAFLLLMVAPLAANLAYVGTGWRLFGADPTGVAFAFSGAGFAWMIARNRLFAVVPLARQRLFAELPDPVLVLDMEQRVVDANEAAQRLIGHDPPLGTPLATLAGLGPPLAALLAAPGSEPMLQLQQASYAVQHSPLLRSGRTVGALLQLHDITAMRRAHDQTLVNLAAREIQLRRATAMQALLREQAMHDPLTGLLNRRALQQRHAQELADAGPRPPALVLVLMDLDHFKRINDAHGHATGDAVLRDFGAALRGGLRADDAVFRIGGEEFVLLLPQADTAQALQRVQALRELLAHWRLGGLAQTLTFSAGVAASGSPPLPLQALLDQADRALYRAKQAGRNRSELAP